MNMVIITFMLKETSGEYSGLRSYSTAEGVNDESNLLAIELCRVDFGGKSHYMVVVSKEIDGEDDDVVAVYHGYEHEGRTRAVYASAALATCISHAWLDEHGFEVKTTPMVGRAS